MFSLGVFQECIRSVSRVVSWVLHEVFLVVFYFLKGSKRLFTTHFRLVSGGVLGSVSRVFWGVLKACLKQKILEVSGVFHGGFMGFSGDFRVHPGLFPEFSRGVPGSLNCALGVFM